jgi:hypothetical protein
MDLQTMLLSIIEWFNGTLIPLLIGIAAVAFLWNMVRYAFLKGRSDEGLESARRLMLWGILALVILTTIWGVVSIFVSFLNLDNRSIISDYQCQETGVNCTGPGEQNPLPYTPPTDSGTSGDYEFFNTDVNIPGDNNSLDIISPTENTGNNGGYDTFNTSVDTNTIYTPQPDQIYIGNDGGATQVYTPQTYDNQVYSGQSGNTYYTPPPSNNSGNTTYTPPSSNTNSAPTIDDLNIDFDAAPNVVLQQLQNALQWITSFGN